MDTLGSLIDKLITIDMKMWYAQEEFYKIRKLTYNEFLEKYQMDDSDGIKDLYNLFQKAIDLNLQRNRLIDEIDTLLVEMLKDGPDDRFIQSKHKTY